MRLHEDRVRARTTDEEAGDGERGAGVVEYALILALIALVCLVAMNTLGQSTSARFDDTAAKVTAINTN